MSGENVIYINPYSITSHSIKLLFNDLELAIGTCFFHKKNEKLFLITNRHNVTGRHNETNKCLSSTAAIPNRLGIRLLKKSEIAWEEVTVNLLDAEGNSLWIEHPKLKEKVDVVALPINIPDKYLFLPIEEAAEPHNEQTEAEVGEDVFILGYPLGVNAGGLPLWKRASIASELSLNIDGLPKFLVDTASRQGMSGSPVILKKRRPVSIGSTSDGGEPKVESRYYNKFLGVYSGRLFSNEKNDAQIGIVWSAKVVDEITESYEPIGDKNI